MRFWQIVFQVGLLVAAVMAFGSYVYTSYHEKELDQEEDDE